ncbi:hypothetical protein ACWPKS_15820 [Coraliomargarita sp. W4R72]
MSPFKKAISDILLVSTYSHSWGAEEVARRSKLPTSVVQQSITYGVVDLEDFVDICRVLGLDSGAVQAEACGRSHMPWHDASETPPTDQWVEIDIKHVTLVAHYLADGDRWQIGADETLPAADVVRWRQISKNVGALLVDVADLNPQAQRQALAS